MGIVWVQNEVDNDMRTRMLEKNNRRKFTKGPRIFSYLSTFIQFTCCILHVCLINQLFVNLVTRIGVHICIIPMVHNSMLLISSVVHTTLIKKCILYISYFIGQSNSANSRGFHEIRFSFNMLIYYFRRMYWGKNASNHQAYFVTPLLVKYDTIFNVIKGTKSVIKAMYGFHSCRKASVFSGLWANNTGHQYSTRMCVSDRTKVVSLRVYGPRWFHRTWIGTNQFSGHEVRWSTITPGNQFLPLKKSGVIWNWYENHPISQLKNIHSLTKTCSIQSSRYRTIPLPINWLYTCFTWLLHKTSTSRRVSLAMLVC